ncbi:MAG: hypothetical protein ACE5OP_12145, partial [Candidatus Glassbacteria bacterium]
MMKSIRSKVLLLLAFLLLLAACTDVTVIRGPFEVKVGVDLPEPLSDEEVGIIVTPDSTVSAAGTVFLDLGTISDHLDDITNIVIAIIPAVVSFDSIGTLLAVPPVAYPLRAQTDSAVTVFLYFAPSGTEDPFSEDFLAAKFFIDIEGSEVTGVSGGVDVPTPLIETIASGHMA